MIYEEFDVAAEIVDYTYNVIYGYVVEKSRNRVEIQINKRDSAVIGGNKPRFRRMFFNLVMNAVDAMQEKMVGMLNITIDTLGQDVTLRVSDNGVGMYPAKIEHLLRERDSLDGDIHSLGFVFVRQTVKAFGGTLDIESEVNKGTHITVRIPLLEGKEAPPLKESLCKKYSVTPLVDGSGRKHNILIIDHNDELRKTRRPNSIDAGHRPETGGDPVMEEIDPTDEEASCGRIIWKDYRISQSQFPGCIFTIGVKYDLTLDVFLHKPYEQHWDIGHEDLNPMIFDSTIRGRLEENNDGVAELILKEPHDVAAYFDFKDFDENERSAEKYISMIHDEYILISRKIIATGLRRNLRVHITSAAKYFPGFEQYLGEEPFLLETLAEQKLSTE